MQIRAFHSSHISKECRIIGDSVKFCFSSHHQEKCEITAGNFLRFPTKHTWHDMCRRQTFHFSRDRLCHCCCRLQDEHKINGKASNLLLKKFLAFTLHLNSSKYVWKHPKASQQWWCSKKKYTYPTEDETKWESQHIFEYLWLNDVKNECDPTCIYV